MAGFSNLLLYSINFNITHHTFSGKPTVYSWDSEWIKQITSYYYYENSFDLRDPLKGLRDSTWSQENYWNRLLMQWHFGIRTDKIEKWNRRAQTNPCLYNELTHNQSDSTEQGRADILKTSATIILGWPKILFGFSCTK